MKLTECRDTHDREQGIKDLLQVWGYQSLFTDMTKEQVWRRKTKNIISKQIFRLLLGLQVEISNILWAHTHNP